MSPYKNYFLILLIAAPCFYTSTQISPQQKHLLHYSAQTATWITTGLAGAAGTCLSLILAKTFTKAILDNSFSWDTIKYTYLVMGATGCFLYTSYQVRKAAHNSYKKAYPSQGNFEDITDSEKISTTNSIHESKSSKI